MHKFKAENKNLYLHLNASDKMPEVIQIDSSRFSQILVNLISNAIKFTNDGGITINMYFKETEEQTEEMHKTDLLSISHFDETEGNENR